MKIEWSAVGYLTETTYYGVVVKASLSQDTAVSNNDRRLCIRMEHEGCDAGGLQLEDLDEVDELIRILTAMRDKVAGLPEWDIFY